MIRCEIAIRELISDDSLVAQQTESNEAGALKKWRAASRNWTTGMQQAGRASVIREIEITLKESYFDLWWHLHGYTLQLRFVMQLPQHGSDNENISERSNSVQAPKYGKHNGVRVCLKGIAGRCFPETRAVAGHACRKAQFRCSLSRSCPSTRCGSAPARSILLMKARRGTRYRRIWRSTVMDWLCTPPTAHSTSTAPSSTRSALSTCAHVPKANYSQHAWW